MRGITRATLAGFAMAALVCAAPAARAQQDDSEGGANEVVVNQAAGRVVVAVVKNAILIGTTENLIESGTRLPVPVSLSTLRVGTALGAVEWTSPSLQKVLGRLDQELPHLRSSLAADAPRLSEGAENQEASDIEAIGKPLRARLSELAGEIHSRVDWPSDEPVLELVLADYLQGYGPEVWQISYTLNQVQQHGDYWVTNVGEPVYLQIWPPEKGQPRTLMEFDYPTESAPASLLQLLRAKDPRVEGLMHGDPRMAETAAKFLGGDSLKISSGDAAQFLRAALGAITTADMPQSVAAISEETGIDWILAPPAEPKSSPSGPEGQRPADAPSLAHPPSGDSGPAPSLAHPPGPR